MRVLITGADGYLGRGLVRRAVALPGISHLVATDRSFVHPLPENVEPIAGDLTDTTFLSRLTAPGFDLVFHLASVPGSLAERKPALGYAVNLHAPLCLAAAAATRRPGMRFVFASSIAVYGDLGAVPVTVETPPRPQLSYGAYKLMTEIFLSDLARRGELSAVCLRLPGLVARPSLESGHGSAFMSQILHKIASDEAYVCPVPALASCWWMSRAAAVELFAHAATLPVSAATVVQPPALHATVSEIAAAAERVTGKKARIDWDEDRTITRLFGAMPPLDASPALKLGFRADSDTEALVRAALEHGVA